MKRIGCFLCMGLLLLAACGKQSNDVYQQGQAELKNGNYTKAWAYFTQSDDPRAALELARLVFVPSEQTSVTSFKEGVNRRAYTYDERGNLIHVDNVFEGETSVVTYTYNEKNLLLTMKEDARTATYTYDEAGKRLTYEWSTEVGVYREEYVYDAQGALEKTLVTFEDGQQTTVYPQTDEAPTVDTHGTCTYDDKGRLLKEVFANGESFTYTYDEYGNKITERYTWNDTTIEWTYRWELRYYPDGMSEPVKALREDTIKRRPVA